MKRLLAALAVVSLVLVAADRLALVVAERAVGTALQRSQGLPERPSVAVTGFPFLTQALSGRYDDVVVGAVAVPVRDLRVARLTVELRGVSVPLRDALSGAVTAVPVDRLGGTAVVAYPELERVSGTRQLRLSPEGDQVRVRGVVTVLGARLEASVLARVTLAPHGPRNVVRLTGGDVQVQRTSLPGPVQAALRGALDLEVPVGGLPFGLVLRSVSVHPDGVELAASGGPAVLARPGP